MSEELPPPRRRINLLDRLSGHAMQKPGTTALLSTAPVAIEWTNDFVSRVVNRMDKLPEKSRLNTGNNTHLSGLIDCCPRQHILAERYGLKLWNHVTGHQRIIWRIGRAVEDHIRTQFIAGVDGVGVIGKWVCRCREKQYRGAMPREVPYCVRCRTLEPIYEELDIVDEDGNVIGNPDLLYLENGLLNTIEIKSKEGEAFKALTEPEGNHVLQAFGYRRLTRIEGFTPSDRVTVIYGSKNAGKWGSSPYKEYHLQAAPEYDAQIERMWSFARTITKARQLKKALPDRHHECTSCTKARAKACPCVTYCFQ